LNTLAFNGQEYVAGRGGSALVTVDRQHWADYLLQPHSEVRRVLWSGQEFWLVGGHRGIFRATCFGMLVSAEPSELQLEVGESAEITVILSEPAMSDITLTVSTWRPMRSAPCDCHHPGGL
jgi:hypothetical protein